MIYDSELASTTTACPNDTDCGYIGNLEEFVDFTIDCEDIKYDQPFFIRCKCPKCETSFISKVLYQKWQHGQPLTLTFLKMLRFIIQKMFMLLEIREK